MFARQVRLIPGRSIGAILAITVVFLTTLAGCSKPTPPPKLLYAAKKALRESDFRKAEDLVEKIPKSTEQWQAGQLVAGEAAYKDGRTDDALAYYLDAADKDCSTSDGQLALFSAAELYLELGQLTRAESLYRDILNAKPDNGLTNERMAFLLSITGRYWESMKYYFALVKGGDANYRELAIAADVARGIEQPEFLRKCKDQCPDDKLVRLALANKAFQASDDNAKELLHELVASSPELVTAQAMLGELLVEKSDDAGFLHWHGSLPADADTAPDIWYVRGLWARRQSDLETAAACFWQTIARTPFHRKAYYMLGQVVSATGDPEAGEIVERSERLVALSMTVDHVLQSEGKFEKAYQETAGHLEELGRIWETCAWGVVARRRFPKSDWPHELLSRHSDKLNEELPWVETEKNPAANQTVGDVPQFDHLLTEVADRLNLRETLVETPMPETGGIRFEEANVIPFVYYNADDPSTKGVRTFEQTGGGVGILDFDRDGVPDVFLPQGSEWKTGATTPTPSPEFYDMLFQNRGDGQFRDVSHCLSGPDSGYGQGCAVGDFNNDGFPDLYVANIGRNALYENMGDGTFINVTEKAGITDASWTASAMICDLNADGLPDLYDVNYLTGKDLYTKICQGKACSPKGFPGASDRVLINQGGGRFVELPDATPKVNSKGLGIVAFELEPNRRPLLFVANDQVANYYLHNKPADNEANMRLSNSALTNGLAFNADGLPMACMGVAAEDFDGNNLIDLFVTNFHNEANTLYLQDFRGLFVDRTKSFGLYKASLHLTGWGSQALDADLDGRPDLVLTNGHVDDYRDVGGMYHMRPQFFRNLGGRFQELTAKEAGPWFGEKYLGRGLAKVDWNQDGRPEFIVSNMNAPLSVLKNTTANTGHFLRFRLSARRTARDAIGTRITVKYANQTVTRQLVAGDGYMASNERVIEFGLGQNQQVDEVTIRWPSGSTSDLTAPPVDGTWIIAEGLELATRSDRNGLTSYPVIVEKIGLP